MSIRLFGGGKNGKMFCEGSRTQSLFVCVLTLVPPEHRLSRWWWTHAESSWCHQPY